MSALTKEIAAYEIMRDDLETDYNGKWALVHDEKLIDVYVTFELAANYATEHFGRGPYLIRQIGGAPISLPASVLYRRAHAGG